MVSLTSRIQHFLVFLFFAVLLCPAMKGVEIHAFLRAKQLQCGVVVHFFLEKGKSKKWGHPFCLFQSEDAGVCSSKDWLGWSFVVRLGSFGEERPLCVQHQDHECGHTLNATYLRDVFGNPLSSAPEQETHRNINKPPPG